MKGVKMKKILFLFDSNGNKFKTIEDADTVGHYNKEFIVFGYDGTKICTLNNEEIADFSFLTLSDNEDVDLNSFNNKYDIEHYSFLQWERAKNAAKLEKVKQAQNDLQFYESRHKKLLELIEYTERELNKAPYFTKEWEKLQRKVITLENQLRQVDSKREKAYSVICDYGRD